MTTVDATPGNSAQPGQPAEEAGQPDVYGGTLLA